MKSIVYFITFNEINTDLLLIILIPINNFIPNMEMIYNKNKNILFFMMILLGKTKYGNIGKCFMFFLLY